MHELKACLLHFFILHTFLVYIYIVDGTRTYIKAKRSVLGAKHKSINILQNVQFKYIASFAYKIQQSEKLSVRLDLF